jgi:hypothetical protein
MRSNNLQLGRALLAELRELFSAEVWLDGEVPRLRYPAGHKPKVWDLAFIKANRADLVSALQEEARAAMISRETPTAVGFASLCADRI